MPMKKFILPLAVIALLSGCTNVNLDDIKDVEYSPSLVLPIGKAHANIMQLMSFVPDSLTNIEEETKTVYLQIEQDFEYIPDMSEYMESANNVFNFGLSSIPTIEDIFNNSSDSKVTLPEGDYKTTVQTKYYFYDTGDNQLSYISRGFFHKANFWVSGNITGANLSETNYIKIRYTFESILIQGQPVVIELPISKNTFEISNILEEIDATFNRESSDYCLTDIEYIIHSDGTLQVDNDALVSMHTNLKDIDYKKIWGHVYEEEPLYSEKQEIDIPLDFSGINSEQVHLLFSRPKMTVNLDNNIGVPCAFNIKSLTVSDEKGNTINAEFNGSQSYSVDLNIPEDKEDDPSAITTIVLDRDNGSLNKLFHIIPSTLSCQYEVITTDKDEDNVHFMPENPRLAANINFELPLIFDEGTYFSHTDTINDINIEASIPEGATVENLNLYLDITNSLPVKTKFSLILLNETGEEIHRTEEITAEAAAVDNEGKVTEPTKQEIKIETNQEFIDKILTTTDIVLSARVEGRDAGSKIYIQTSNALDVNISAFIKLKAELNLQGQE